ncbi:MAG: LPS assembly lipoprotein LptE [Planctomycetaceae bacterium]|jgi:hypothetical protein|nr:LPS assembly lipoprotein LptE [Planctomycetaceae bacterium]
MTPSQLTGAVLSLLLVFMTGCAGYHVGTESLYRRDVKTVHVPVFMCDSYRRQLGERLTEAVCKRIEARTPFKVVGRPSADTTLAGRIVSDTQYVSIADDYNGPRQKNLNLTVLVEWRDHRGNMIRSLEPIEVDIETGSYLVAEMGQSYATASQESIDKMADQIVNMMTNPW